jgi:hypothetical protein
MWRVVHRVPWSTSRDELLGNDLNVLLVASRPLIRSSINRRSFRGAINSGFQFAAVESIVRPVPSLQARKAAMLLLKNDEHVVGEEPLSN